MVDAKRGDMVGFPGAAKRLGTRISSPCGIVQANEFNLSRINTVIVAVITSNLRLAEGMKLTLLCPTYILIHFDVGEGDYEGRRDRFTG
jgi:hypothetical protein